MNPKTIKHRGRNSGRTEDFRSLGSGDDGMEDVEVCSMGGPLGHAGGWSSEAHLETWERQRIRDKLCTRKNVAWAAQGGEQ